MNSPCIRKPKAVDGVEAIAVSASSRLVVRTRHSVLSSGASTGQQVLQQRVDVVVGRDLLGGLIHEYELAA
jgi:hypothetical protein